MERGEKSVALSGLNIYYIWNNKLKILGQTWNDEFKLPGESYSISDIQDYFQYNIENLETLTNNPPLKVNINKI